MQACEQGELLRVSGIAQPVLVVSNNFFCRSGRAIVCPVVRQAAAGPLHIPVRAGEIEGIVLCEQVRYVDLTVRHFAKLGSVPFFDVMDLSDAVMGMFDYQTV